MRPRRPRASRLPSLVVLLLPLLLCATGRAKDDARGARAAPHVVFRAPRDLHAAGEVASHEAWRDPERPRPVAIVVDATPFTAFAAREIESALAGLEARLGSECETWWIGRLGEPLTRRARGPARLAERVGSALARPSRGPDTVQALERSLARFRARGGLALYVADRHFEDGAGLEALLARLRDRDQMLCVVGPEAGFGLPYDDRAFLASRGPFGPELASAAWPTGDTAWPHWPGRLLVNTWIVRRPHACPVDLDERLWQWAEAARRGRAPDREAFLASLRGPDVERILHYAPPPSSFGPYALMRLCAETGGRYCLWSWNPLAEPGPVYDYGRCNLHAPDLRPRSAIRADVARRPLPGALLRAWETLASPTVGIAARTPPVRPDGIPVAMRRAPGRRIPHPWGGEKHREAFLAGIDRLLDRLDLTADALASAIAAADRPDDVDRRYRADAELLLHFVRLERFSHAEMRRAWLAFETEGELARTEGRPLRFQPEGWVRGGPSPDDLRLGPVPPYDLRAGQALLGLHRSFLARFRGTPYAELVSRNAVHTWRIVGRELAPGGRGRSGGASSRPPPPPPAVTPGSSTGSGPATGR